MNEQKFACTIELSEKLGHLDANMVEIHLRLRYDHRKSPVRWILTAIGKLARELINAGTHL
jgi:hypothetical protein